MHHVHVTTAPRCNSPWPGTITADELRDALKQKGSLLKAEELKVRTVAAETADCWLYESSRALAQLDEIGAAGCLQANV